MWSQKAVVKKLFSEKNVYETYIYSIYERVNEIQYERWLNVIHDIFFTKLYKQKFNSKKIE